MLKKIGSAIAVIITVVIIAWFALSWAEVLHKNLTPNPTYSEYNFFVKFLEFGDEVGYND